MFEQTFKNIDDILHKYYQAALNLSIAYLSYFKNYYTKVTGKVPNSFRVKTATALLSGSGGKQECPIPTGPSVGSSLMKSFCLIGESGGQVGA